MDAQYIIPNFFHCFKIIRDDVISHIMTLITNSRGFGPTQTRKDAQKLYDFSALVDLIKTFDIFVQDCTCVLTRKNAIIHGLTLASIMKIPSCQVVFSVILCYT